jgi:Alternative complex III, ActD subunit
MSDTFCLAKFSQPANARQAIRRLIQSGVDPGVMEVMTSQPIHGQPFLPERKSTKLRTWALSGAAIGMTGGFLLATVTALNYPIVKGGMPIVAPWTVGIITYEATMLGAVLATLAGLLIELRLPNFGTLPYDESVTDGGVVLAVKCAPAGPSARASVQDVVSSAGATKVNWL